MSQPFEATHRIRAADGVEIVCLARMPNLPIKGAYLLLHGISTNKNEYLSFFETVSSMLADRGFASLRIDFRGHGDSPVSPDYFTIGSQILDARAALSFLQGLAGVQAVNLFGCSFGAPPCIFLKASSVVKVGKVVVLSPVLDYRNVFLQPVSAWGRATFPHDKLVRCLALGEPVPMDAGFYMSPALLASLMHADVEASIRQMEGRVLVLHGDHDGFVPLELSREIAARNSNVKLVEFSNMEHGFTDRGDESGDRPETVRNIVRIVDILVREAES